VFIGSCLVVYSVIKVLVVSLVIFSFCVKIDKRIVVFVAAFCRYSAINVFLCLFLYVTVNLHNMSCVP